MTNEDAYRDPADKLGWEHEPCAGAHEVGDTDKVHEQSKADSYDADPAFLIVIVLPDLVRESEDSDTKGKDHGS